MRSTLFTILAFLLISNANADTEPNDIWQDAQALPQDRTVAGTQSDDDWYVINVVAGNRILIDLTFSNAAGNIDMSFYDISNILDVPPLTRPGTVRVFTDSISDHEFIDNDVSGFGPGTYYIKVFGEDNGNSYTLTWTELTGTDDDFEENDAILTAKGITEGVVAFGSQSDPDVYRIEVISGNERVIASLRFNNAGKLDLVLSDNVGTQVAFSSNSTGINEAIDVDVLIAGTYHLEVTGASKGDGYALNWAGVSPTSSAVFPAPTVNEVPQATANTVSTTENTSYNFMVSDFTFSDSEGDSLVSATLNNLSLGGGTLTHSSGTPVSNADRLTAAQLDTLVYIPATDATGSPLATFTFTVNDFDDGTVSAQLDINVTAAATTTTTTDTGSSSGALAPAGLLVLLLTGLLRRKRC